MSQIITEESRDIDGVRITRITQPCKLTGEPYASWTGQAGFARSASPTERYKQVVGLVRVRGPEPADEQTQAKLALIRKQDPGLAARLEARLNGDQAGGLFKVGPLGVSLNAVSGPPSASFLSPEDLAVYVGRHASGDLGGFGRVPDYAKLTEAERFAPPLHGRHVEAADAIHSGHGVIISSYPVWAPDRPLTRKGDSIFVVTLIHPRGNETTVVSDRDGVSLS